MADLVPRHAAMAASDRAGLPAALAKRQPRSGAAQHRRALRLVERPVRRVPRRNHDVLMRAVQRAAGVVVRFGRGATTVKSTGCWISADVRPGQPGARDRHRMGRAVHPRGRPRSTRPLGDPVGRTAAAGPASGCRGGTVRLGADRPLRLPRHRRVLRRSGVGRDDRGSRISRVASDISPRSNGWCGRAGG